MAERTVLSDELVRQLIAVGQVDVLVALPTFRNAVTVGGPARAAVIGLARHFPRARTALLNVDGGSPDGTRDALLQATGPELDREIAAHSLRTIHRISAPYTGIPGKGTALRAIFAAADLLQARAVALLDPTVTNVTPEWIRALVHPVLQEGRDFVLPACPRHPLDGPLVSQLIRPFVGAVYARRVREPVGGEFGCSGAFASYCLSDTHWEREMAPLGVDTALCLNALAGPFAACQVAIEARTVSPDAPHPALPDAFRQVVGTMFDCMEAHHASWSARDGTEEVPWFGAPPEPPAGTIPAEPGPLLESFRTGVRELGEILQTVLAEPTLAAIREAAGLDAGAFRLDDDVWVSAVYEFATAHQRQAIHRSHVVQALVPLYLGRAASFLLECGGLGEAPAEARLEALMRRFEAMKPLLTERWAPQSGERDAVKETAP